MQSSICLHMSGDGRFFSDNIPLNVMHHDTENNMTCLQKNVELTNCALCHLSKKATRILL